MIEVFKERSDKKSLAPVIGSMRILHFRIPPYSYAGSFEYEQEYLQTYLDDENSFFIISGDPNQSKIDGILTAIPFSKVHDWFGDAGNKYEEKGYSLDDILYIGEIIVSPEARGQSVAKRMIESFLSIAKPQFKLSNLCTHSLSTADNELYRKMGYSESGIVVSNKYPTIESFTTIKDHTHNHIFLEQSLCSM